MAAKKPVKNSTKSVTNITHEDAKRRNIPTAELQPVMPKEVADPIRVVYERRNRDLDPPRLGAIVRLLALGGWLHQKSSIWLAFRQCGENQIRSRAALSRPMPLPWLPYPPDVFHGTHSHPGISCSPS